MDWRQLIIDHPLLAMATALPLFAFAIAVKVAITLSNPGQQPTGRDEAEPGEPT